MSSPVFSLADKVAIVTGGKRGIGKAIALAFAEAGADVAICDRVIEDGELEATAEEIQKLGQRSLAIQADVARKAEVDNLVQKVMHEFGTVDILVNNAGIMIRALLLDMPEDDWEKVINVHLKGCYLCCQAVGRIMTKQGRGSIINIASIAAIKANIARGAYGAAKAGILMLTRVLALEVGSYNVRVNAIAPGFIKTELNRSIWDDPEALKQFLTGRPIALGRAGDTSEITGAAIFLASDASSYMTGQTIVIDGGVSC